MPERGDPDATPPMPGPPVAPPGPIDATVPVTALGPPGEPPREDGDGRDGDGGGALGRVWLVVAVSMLVVGLLVGSLIALLTDGGDASRETATSTTRTTASTTATTAAAATTTAAAATTTVPAPAISQFSTSGGVENCRGSDQLVELTWATQNAQTVTIAVDGDPIGGFGPSGSTQAPFTCPAKSHQYTLTATGGGTAAQQVLTVEAAAPGASDANSHGKPRGRRNR